MKIVMLNGDSVFIPEFHGHFNVNGKSIEYTLLHDGPGQNVMIVNFEPFQFATILGRITGNHLQKFIFAFYSNEGDSWDDYINQILADSEAIENDPDKISDKKYEIEIHEVAAGEFVLKLVFDHICRISVTRGFVTDPIESQSKHFRLPSDIALT